MSDCILWDGPKLRGGYGTTRDCGRKVLAHRRAWEREHGAIPRGLFVLHRCDVPACVNPDHLFLGTQSENMYDCAAKGRHRGSNGKVRGENSPHAKLTWEKAREIRQRVGESGPALGREYGVSHRIIYLIQQGKAWKESV